MKSTLLTFAGIDGMTLQASELLQTEAADACTQRGVFNLAISGGSTPVKLFSRLGGELADCFPAFQTQVFWCDERCVSPDHRWSNFGLANRLWFQPAAFPSDNLYPVSTKFSRNLAARKYEELLRRYFPVLERTGSGSIEGQSTFDLCILGMGVDGHVASLFPQSPALAQSERWVMGVRAPMHVSPQVDRVTLTLEILCRSRVVMVMVAGKQKAAIVARILAGEPEVAALPAARIGAQKRIYWLVAESGLVAPFRVS